MMSGFMTQRRNKPWRIAAWVVAVHLVIILTLSVIPWVRSLFRRPAPVIIPIELTMFVPPPPPEPISLPQPPEPAPVVEPPVRQQAAVTNTPPAPPDPPPRQRPPIQVSQNWVERRSETSPPPPAPRPELTADQLRNLLSETLSTAPASAAPSTDARDLDLIRQTLHQAWRQPSGHHLRGRITEVTLTLDEQGLIRHHSIQRSSGDAAMDASVSAAMNAVRRVPGLSPGFAARRSPVTIYFEID